VARFTEYRLGRQLALQFLFSLEFQDLNWRLALPEFWNMDPMAASRASLGRDEVFAAPQERIRANQVEEARRFAEFLIEGVCTTRAELDTLITSALDNWKPERVGKIEWAIMRLALYEMLYSKDCPDTVVISEAVRIATLFGDTESPRFVNGLLNRFLEHGSASPEIPDAHEMEQP
jgi:transcription antitermination protein NusB